MEQICTFRGRCKREALSGRKWCQHHADIERRKTLRLTNRYKEEGKCRYCTAERLIGFMVCEKHRANNREKCRQRHYRLRDEVLTHYGKVCKCCGEDNPAFLTIDHINEDGGEHRRKEKIGAGGSTYAWLKRHGFPEGFQTLCWNCNEAKRIYGVCPHANSVCNAGA